MNEGSPPDLILSGLTLGNPYVGQGAYTARLISALSTTLKNRFKVIIPDWINIPATPLAEQFLSIPAGFSFRHSLIRQVVSAEKLVSFVSREFPDAVFHSPGPIIGRRRSPRTVVTLHDCIYRTFPNYLGRFFVRRIFMRATERFAAQANLVLTDSEFSRKDLLQRVGLNPDRLEVLYPWVGNEFFRPFEEEELGEFRKRFDLPPRFWLYLGGFDYRKNVAFLLRAYSRAKEKRFLPPLVLAGHIPLKKHRSSCDVMGALREARLTQENVRLVGAIASEDLPILYRSASLLVYPSLMEGFGFPPAEAMAAGTPVLAAKTSSLPEVVRREQCLFDPEKEDELIDRLLAAADDEKQFQIPLPEIFTEAFGIKRYLKLLGKAGLRTNSASNPAMSDSSS